MIKISVDTKVQKGDIIYFVGSYWEVTAVDKTNITAWCVSGDYSKSNFYREPYSYVRYTFNTGIIVNR